MADAKTMFEKVENLPRKAGSTNKGVDQFLETFVTVNRPAKKDQAYRINIDSLPDEMLGRTTREELKKSPRNLQVRIGVAASHRWPKQDIISTSIRDEILYVRWCIDESEAQKLFPIDYPQEEGSKNGSSDTKNLDQNPAKTSGRSKK